MIEHTTSNVHSAPTRLDIILVQSYCHEEQPQITARAEALADQMAHVNNWKMVKVKGSPLQPMRDRFIISYFFEIWGFQ